MVALRPELVQPHVTEHPVMSNTLSDVMGIGLGLEMSKK